MQIAEPRRRHVPAYKRVELQIRDHVRIGRWTVGAMLPSRQGLAKEYSVSMGTIERAVAKLIGDGVLRADSRRGTFVASNGDEQIIRERETQNGVSPILAKTPRAGKGETLGIIASYPTEFVNDTGYMFYWIQQIAHSLSSAFLDEQERTLMFNIYPTTGLSKDIQQLVPIATALDSLIRQGATSIAIIDIHNEIADQDLEDLIANLKFIKIPIVYIANHSAEIPLPHVFVDIPQVGALAVRFLIEQGHTRITFVSPLDHPWVQERFQSVRQGAKLLGLDEDAIQFKSIDPPLSGHQFVSEIYAASYECGRQLLSGEHSSALIAADDNIAYGIIDAGKEIGLVAGQDYSIIGFDDTPKSLLYGLTTFRPPLEMLGEESAALLKRMAVAGRTIDYQIGFNSQLILRSSTRRI